MRGTGTLPGEAGATGTGTGTGIGSCVPATANGKCGAVESMPPARDGEVTVAVASTPWTSTANLASASAALASAATARASAAAAWFAALVATSLSSTIAASAS